MTRLHNFLTALLLLCNLSACSQTQPSANTTPIKEEIVDTAPLKVNTPKEVLPLGAKALLVCYPNFIKQYHDGKLTLQDGTAVAYDDGKRKTFIEQMDNADIEDMFALPYDTSVWLPTRNYDPGRIRNEELMKHMYGKTEQEVRKNMVRVKWFNQQLLFSKINGAADSLKAVYNDLATLPASYRKFFEQSSTFNWRTVRGSNRLSAHSYGMTIDICTKFSDFWRWKNPGKEEMDEIVYVNRIPKEIIRIFEKHGFISGARWYHYDTMHFEFRPDLLYYSHNLKN